MEGPVHGEKDVVVHDVGLVVSPGVGGIQVDDVDDFRNAESSAPVGPNHFVFHKIGLHFDEGLGRTQVAASAGGKGGVVDVDILELTVVAIEAVQHQLLESGSVTWRKVYTF